MDLKKLSDVAANEVVKNRKFNTLKTKVNSLEKKIPNVSIVNHKNKYNTDKQKLEKRIGDVDKKLPDMSGSVNTTVLNTKISEVENKIPNTSGLVTTVKLRIKFLIMINVYNSRNINFASRLKQANLVKTGFDKN